MVAKNGRWTKVRNFRAGWHGRALLALAVGLVLLPAGARTQHCDVEDVLYEAANVLLINGRR